MTIEQLLQSLGQLGTAGVVLFLYLRLEQRFDRLLDVMINIVTELEAAKHALAANNTAHPAKTQDEPSTR